MTILDWANLLVAAALGCFGIGLGLLAVAAILWPRASDVEGKLE